MSNGYLGIRGMLEEGTPVREPGVLLNGFYEHRPISYGERAHGFPALGQSILNCPDGTTVKLFVEDELFVLTTAEILSFRLPVRKLRGDHNLGIGIFGGKFVLSPPGDGWKNETRRTVLRRRRLPDGVVHSTSRLRVPSRKSSACRCR